MHSTWDTSPKEKTVLDGLLYAQSPDKKSPSDKFLFLALRSHVRE
jgi:hypothetical protein